MKKAYSCIKDNLLCLVLQECQKGTNARPSRPCCVHGLGSPKEILWQTLAGYANGPEVYLTPKALYF